MMEKIIRKIYKLSDGKVKDMSLLKEVTGLKNKNIFWYPSAWKDTQYIKKYNHNFVRENNTPKIGLFLHSDYRYYQDFFKEINIPYIDKENKLEIEKIEGYFLLTEQERIEYMNIFEKHYFHEIQYAPVNEPDIWITKTRIDGIKKPVFIIYTQLENNYLLYNVIKPFELPVKYICTHCDGKDEGGNRTSFLEKPFSTNFHKHIEENGVV